MVASSSIYKSTPNAIIFCVTSPCKSKLIWIKKLLLLFHILLTAPTRTNLGLKVLTIIPPSCWPFCGESLSYRSWGNAIAGRNSLWIQNICHDIMNWGSHAKDTFLYIKSHYKLSMIRSYSFCTNTIYFWINKQCRPLQLVPLLFLKPSRKRFQLKFKE